MLIVANRHAKFNQDSMIKSLAKPNVNSELIQLISHQRKHCMISSKIVNTNVNSPTEIQTEILAQTHTSTVMLSEDMTIVILANKLVLKKYHLRTRKQDVNRTVLTKWTDTLSELQVTRKLIGIAVKPPVWALKKAVTTNVDKKFQQ